MTAIRVPQPATDMTTDVVTRDKVVSVTYTLHNQRGDVFEQSDVPISYLHGHDSGLFHKVESALEGRGPGDSVEVTLAPEEGFGHYDASLTFTDDAENVPPELRHIGAQLEAQNARNEILTFIVTRIENGKLTVDANHPLAGQTVRFRVTVREVRDATPEELRAGQAGAKNTLQ
jgi:FKBP-type peptidyl-prolyl cis-trans isomerase SlyD